MKTAFLVFFSALHLYSVDMFSPVATWRTIFECHIVVLMSPII